MYDVGQARPELLRELVEQASEARHAVFEVLEPSGWMPHFDTHGRSNDQDLAAGFDAQKLSKSLGNHQPPTARQLNGAMPG
jgi:hypothetical protein